MKWLVAVTDFLRCGRCRSAIGQGEPYALVGDVEIKRCLECMRVAFNVDPPPEVWAKVPDTDVLPEQVKAALARHTGGV